MSIGRRLGRAHRLTEEDSMERLPEPTGFTCEYCAGEIAGDLACSGCGACHSHCPFCGTCAYGATACEHLLQADGDDDDISSVLSEMDVPTWEDGDVLIEDVAPYLDEAFGDLASLVEEYSDYSPPAHLRILMEGLVERIKTPVSVVSWSCDKPMLSSMGYDYYAAGGDRLAAIGELEKAVRQIRDGFQYIRRGSAAE